MRILTLFIMNLMISCLSGWGAYLVWKYVGRKAEWRMGPGVVYHVINSDMAECSVHTRQVLEQVSSRMGIRRRAAVKEGYGVMSLELDEEMIRRIEEYDGIALMNIDSGRGTIDVILEGGGVHLEEFRGEVIPTNANNCRLYSITSERIGTPERNVCALPIYGNSARGTICTWAG